MKRTRERQAGFVVSSEVMLIGTLLVIGLLAGLQAVRTAASTELADLGAGIASIAQSYEYSGIAGHHASSNGSLFQDAADTCDDFESIQNNVASRCVAICDANCGNPFAHDTDARPEDGDILDFTTF